MKTAVCYLTFEPSHLDNHGHAHKSEPQVLPGAGAAAATGGGGHCLQCLLSAARQEPGGSAGSLRDPGHCPDLQPCSAAACLLQHFCLQSWSHYPALS